MVGVVDIGSNTIRLSCYEIEDDNTFSCAIHKKVVAGLANYIDENDKMTEEGIEKIISVIKELKKVISHVEFKGVHFFATAAIRNTINCDEIVSKVETETECKIHVLSGEEEAICDFLGVCEDETVQSGMVVDIGGGSTEIIPFENQTVRYATSLNVGSLNMYKKHVKNVVPDKIEISEMEKSIKTILSKEKKIENKIKCAYGVGGSIRAVLRIYNKEYRMDENNRNMDAVKLKNLLKLYNEDKSYLVDKIVKIAPERIHTVIPGLVILCMIIKKYDLNMIKVSRYGAREGYLMKYVLPQLNGKEGSHAILE